MEPVSKRYVKDGVSDIESLLNVDPPLMVAEATEYLDHPDPEKTFRRQERLHNVCQAVGAATLFGLSYWMIARGQHSVYEQVVNGFRGMEQ